MLQKNKLTPFSFALTSIFITILLFIIFGSNGWGPAAANEQAIGEISRWCERVSGGFFREPANTLGNLGFVFVGLYMFYKLSKDATSNHSPLFGSFKIALLYASASTFLGPASMAMHGTHTQFGAWLDNVSMISYVLILWIYNLKKLTKKLKKIYKEHTKLNNKDCDIKLNDILKRDLWWDSDECIKYGLVDRVGSI